MTCRTLGFVLGVLLMPLAWAAGGGGHSAGAIENAWIGGKLEAAYALNPHLNPFKIETDVDDGVVTLTGTVDSDIDRDLAGEVAKGVEGVTKVDNELQVDAKAARRSDDGTNSQRGFGQWVGDATTTAAVKTKLVADTNIEARHIDVDTMNGVVTLKGEVASDEQQELAERIAKNTNGVHKVVNDLAVVQDPQ